MTRIEKAAPLLALLRRHESDPAVAAQGVPSAYDVVFGGIPKKHRPMAPLTTYTVGEVIEWQGFVVAKGAASSAAGAFQIIRKTLVSLKLPDGRRFDRECQDEAALTLLDRRGWEKCEQGRMTPESFADQIAREWASLPVQKAQQGASRTVQRGMSYYAGDGLNKAHASPEEVMQAIRASLAAPEPPMSLEERVAALEAAVAALQAAL